MLRHDFVLSILKHLEYRKGHLEVIALDAWDVIQRLPNCQSIVQDVADLDLRDCEATILAVFYNFLYMLSVWSTDAKLLSLLFHL